MSRLEDLKTRIKEALPGLDCVIAWQKGFDPLHNTPLFIRSEADVDKLEWGPFNVHNPAVYLPAFRGKKVGVVVKGCDSRSVVELLQENLIDRADVVIFSMPCTGVIDLTKVKARLAAAGTSAGTVTAVATDGNTLSVTAGGETVAIHMRADGVIVSIDSWGNSHVDFTAVLEALGERNIPAVGLSFVGTEAAFVVTNPYMARARIASSMGNERSIRWQQKIFSWARARAWSGSSGRPGGTRVS